MSTVYQVYWASGALNRDRTDDLRITSALLYQLSYQGKNGGLSENRTLFSALRKPCVTMYAYRPWSSRLDLNQHTALIWRVQFIKLAVLYYTTRGKLLSQNLTLRHLKMTIRIIVAGPIPVASVPAFA
jgi:hypothetical protein